MSGGVLDYFRKHGGSPLGALLHCLQWLIEAIVPGKAGRVLAGAVVVIIFAYALIVMNYRWLPRMLANLFPPAH